MCLIHPYRYLFRDQASDIYVSSLFFFISVGGSIIQRNKFCSNFLLLINKKEHKKKGIIAGLTKKNTNSCLRVLNKQIQYDYIFFILIAMRKTTDNFENNDKKKENKLSRSLVESNRVEFFFSLVQNDISQRKKQIV
jgi:hypothetical protein